MAMVSIHSKISSVCIEIENCLSVKIKRGVIGLDRLKIESCSAPEGSLAARYLQKYVISK